MKKTSKLFILLLFFISLISFSSCSGTEKSATAALNSNTSFICDHDSTTDTTFIQFPVIVYNNSIYNISNCSFKFNLYKDGEYLRTTKFIDYDFSISHGSTGTINLNFTASGEITDVKINAWNANYASIWSTYQIWFILTIIIIAIIAIISIIVIIVNDLDFDDIIDFIEEKFYFLFIFLIPFILYVIEGFSSEVWSLVPIIIILCGILSIIIVICIAILIKNLVIFIPGANYFTVDSNNKMCITVDENGNEYSIDDLKDNKELLMTFNKESLCDWCRNNNITGYSKLNKAELVDLIANSNDINNENVEIKKKKINSNSSKTNSQIRFDDIAGLNDAKEAFKEKVILPFEHPEIFEKFGKKIGGGILLYGLPGTGKTMFAEAASNELDALFISIKCSDIKSKWYGESEQNVKKIFQKARKAKRSIIFFDEFEAIGAKRTDNSDNANNDLVPEILAEMQGVGTDNSESIIMVIAATNKPWSIDSAFLRPGRFDEKIYIPLPDYEARKKLFELQLSKLPVSSDLDYNYLAEITDGFNGADIKEFCEKLKMSAIKQSLTKNSEQTIGMDDVLRIKGTMKSSVLKEDIDRFEEFERNI